MPTVAQKVWIPNAFQPVSTQQIVALTLSCSRAGPRWASANLGIFVCIRCSGIHRNLGVHISFVRSVSLDEWQTKHVKNMVRWGNRRANEYWEATVPEDYYIPDENDSVSTVERCVLGRSCGRISCV